MEQIIIYNKDIDKAMLVADSDVNEVCGVMIGNDNKVQEIIMVKNEKPSPYYFTFSSAELGKVYIYAMQKNMKILGIYHSHPQNRPNPSSIDYDWMEEHKGVWLIYSPMFKYYKSWRRKGSDILPVETVIKNVSTTEYLQNKIWNNKEDEQWERI